MHSIIKFFHVLCGISFFGITIASFYYITRSIKKGDRALVGYSIRASYFGDGLILACIFIQITTSISLVTTEHFSLKIPWIFVAYLAFGLLIILWLLTLLIKKIYFSGMAIPPPSLKSYYVLNSAMILIFIMIIHDAVTQSTRLEFLFRE